jgi:hypothetical protein
MSRAIGRNTIARAVQRATWRLRRRLMSRSDVKRTARVPKPKQPTHARGAHDATPPGRNGCRYRRSRIRSRRRARGAAPRLERQLARHQDGHGKPSGAAQRIALDAISFAGLRGKGVIGAMTGGLRLLKAFWDCLRILRARGAHAVLGMGGYVCFPGGLMASLLGKPLVLVNADASLLLSTRSLLPVADAVAFGFDGPAAEKTKHALVTGNPVRDEIENLPTPTERFRGRNGPLSVLVVGGSLGAKVLNEIVPAALSRLDPRSGRTWCTKAASCMQTRCAPPTPRCASGPRCRSSTTCQLGWRRAT